MTFDQGMRELVIVHRPGTETSTTTRLPTPALTAHSITRDDGVHGGGYWIVDPGIASNVKAGHVVTRRQAPWVGLVLDDGAIGVRLAKPRTRAFRSMEFRPTALAVTNGPRGVEYWLTDGYGSDNVLRYDATGGYLGLVDTSGLEPAGLRVPHAIVAWVDGGVLVADREHGRIVVVDDEGTAVRSLGQGRLSRPAALVARGSDIVIAELDGRVTVVDPIRDTARTLVGSRYHRPGRYWPNDGREGRIRAPAYRSSAVMRSPHGLAVDDEGTVWVSEWVVGGRLTSIR